MKLVYLPATVAVLALTACSSSPKPAPSPSVPASASASARVYQATGNPCDRVDQNSLAAVLGPLTSSRSTPGVGGGSAVTRSCSFRFGSSIPVEVSIQLAPDGASVAAYYQGLRAIEQKQTQISTVSGLGQDAYTYEDATGPHLIAYDNNLFLSYAVVLGALPPASVPSGAVGAAVASAHATMDRLVR